MAHIAILRGIAYNKEATENYHLRLLNFSILQNFIFLMIVFFWGAHIFTLLCILANFVSTFNTQLKQHKDVCECQNLPNTDKGKHLEADILLLMVRIQGALLSFPSTSCKRDANDNFSGVGLV